MVAVCGVVTVKQKPFTSQEIRKIGQDFDSNWDQDGADDHDDHDDHNDHDDHDDHGDHDGHGDAEEEDKEVDTFGVGLKSDAKAWHGNMKYGTFEIPPRL